MNNTAIVILAGGASTRMGQDKASLIIEDGRTLLDHMLEKYTQYPIFISGSFLNRNRNNYIEILDIFAERFGPVAGIISSIKYLINRYPNIEQCVFIPIDLVSLDKSDLLKLIETKYNIAYFKNSPLPVKIKLSKSVLEICNLIIDEICLNKGYSVYKFLQKFNSLIELNTSNLHSLTNINYPQDWERFLNEYLSK